MADTTRWDGGSQLALQAGVGRRGMVEGPGDYDVSDTTRTVIRYTTRRDGRPGLAYRRDHELGNGARISEYPHELSNGSAVWLSPTATYAALLVEGDTMSQFAIVSGREAAGMLDRSDAPSLLRFALMT